MGRERGRREGGRRKGGRGRRRKRQGSTSGCSPQSCGEVKTRIRHSLGKPERRALHFSGPEDLFPQLRVSSAPFFLRRLTFFIFHFHNRLFMYLRIVSWCFSRFSGAED